MQINSTNGYWVASVPAEGGTFRFCFIKEGYEYLEKVVEIEPFKKLEFIRFAFNTELKRKPKEKQLNDVVIKATKIKFYNKGDTLIYNADAFNLAEGSMLDNLVKSIPGAELNDNGEIKVNGRKIDALLLNGEDFFKGKNNIMLDNLPAYMVKNIKVYDRKDPYALLTGKNLEGDYVMDVNLKKQYSIGNIGNMEVGMGSENRYLARLFALRFTDASRIGVYANFNNLNDKRKPGENSNWTPDNMPSGLLAQKMGGIDYNFKPKYSLNKFTGNVELAYTSLDSHSETAKETFLPEGNTYSKSRRTERNSNFGASTFHIWELRKANGLDGIEIKPSLRYNHFDRLSGGLAATFNENPYDYAKNKALLDSIQNMNGENLRRIMLNRNCRDIKSRGYDFFANTEVVYKYFYRNYIGFSLAGNIKYDYKK
ncbi:MAG: hypothetical protein ACI4TR_00020, partial [Bacteroidaceae bacterium]